MSAANKIQEGCDLKLKAEKCLKTSVLKWRPDYDSAADAYTKAATAFRIGKSYDQSEECLHKAVDCHKNNRSWFHAAKCHEQIVIVLKEKNCLLSIAENANKACNLYQQHGSSEAAVACLDRAAKVVEAQHPEMALEFYEHALEIVKIEESIHSAAEFACKVSRLLVKLKRFDQAADAIRREIGLNQQIAAYGQIGRLAVALVLVQLGRGDFVAAEKAFKEWGNCCDPQEVQTLEVLLQAFDSEDPELAQKTLMSPFIRHMDVEYASLARDIPLPHGLTTAPKADVIKNAAATYVSANADLLDQSAAGVDIAREEEEDDLC